MTTQVATVERPAPWYTPRSVPRFWHWVTTKTEGKPSPVRVLIFLVGGYVTLYWACMIVTGWLIFAISPFGWWFAIGWFGGRAVRANVRAGVLDAARDAKAGAV